MAQPNVVREPSMEEILASIRRIIESNEPISSQGLATVLAEPAGFSGTPANDDIDDFDESDSGSVEEVTLTIDRDMAVAFESNRGVPYSESVSDQHYSALSQADFDGVHKSYPSPNVFSPEAATIQPAVTSKTLSLADVAARVRAASERNGALRHQQQRSVEESALESPLMTAKMAAKNAGSIFLPDDDFSAQPGEGSIEITIQPTALFNEAVDLQVSPSIISPAAEEKISRSFDDLASVVELSSRRTLDEISTELLRPMLKEWLDANLPTLVEHLVREEIERVARGPRR